jgi:uncharacterized membrane protein
MEVNKTRVEAFSDGVFAIAITLLVLTVAQPRTYRDLAHELATQWPSLAAYIVSFTVIGIMWINHHSVFMHLEHVDRGVLYLNLVLLMTIAFLPYPTGVLGQALAKGQGTRTAAVVYGIVMTINACAWSVLWLYAVGHRRLLRPDFPEEQRSTATLLFTVGVLVYAISIGVALLNAYAFLAVQGLLAVYYALDPISRRAARRGRTDQGGAEAAEGSDLPD